VVIQIITIISGLAAAFCVKFKLYGLILYRF